MIVVIASASVVDSALLSPTGHAVLVSGSEDYPIKEKGISCNVATSKVS